MGLLRSNTRSQFSFFNKNNLFLKEIVHFGGISVFIIDLVSLKISWPFNLESRKFTNFERISNFNELLLLLDPAGQKQTYDIFENFLKNKKNFLVEFKLKNQSKQDLRFCMRMMMSNTNQKTEAIGLLKIISPTKTPQQESSEFISMISHELKNPLAVAKSYTQLLKKVSNNPQHLTYLDTIERSVDQTAEIINNLSFLRKMAQGQLMLEKQHFYPQDLLEKITSTFKIKFPGRTISLNLKNNTVISGDFELLSQALTGLLGYMQRHSEKSDIITINSLKQKMGLIINVTNQPKKSAAIKPKLIISPNQKKPGELLIKQNVSLLFLNELLTFYGGELNCFITPKNKLVFRVVLASPLD